jgi:thioredoxin reductase
MVKRTLLVVDATIGARRRVAPRAEPTSDETRFRGFALALAVGALASVVALALVVGPRSLGSPGPLARPHELAGLECESCHASSPATRSCGGCHGAQRKLRTGHEALRAEGAIGCATCHAIHRAEEGITLAAAGGALHWGSGFEQDVATPDAFRTSDVSVPLVRASACTTCHTPAASDPAAACLPDARGYNVCFDEHRRAGSAAGGKATRDAAWQVAREIAAEVRPPARRPLPAFAAIFAGLAACALTLVAERRVRRRRGNAPPASARPSVLELRAPERRRLPVIDATRCLGCDACVDACPYDVLEVRRFVAVVARPDDCCGLTLCEQRCPNGSLVVRDAGEAPSGKNIPRFSEDLEAEDCPGVFLAGDVTGTALIRHAVAQGARAARAALRSLEEKARAPGHDLVVVGAGPAGLSAALTAHAAGLDVLVLEQGGVAESIRSFPRDKIVFDASSEEPQEGPLWLSECSKEELVAHWERALRRAKLAIQERSRVERIRRTSSGFELEMSPAQDSGARSVRARRVLLAIGRRGTPRRLAAPVPTTMQPHVHYHLADARSFAGRSVLVVGLGDQALEAIAALAAQRDTRIVVSYRGDGFRRGKRRNIEAVERLAASGRVRMIWHSEVTSIERGAVGLGSSVGQIRVECDAVLALIGSLPAEDLLESLGLVPHAG